MAMFGVPPRVGVFPVDTEREEDVPEGFAHWRISSGILTSANVRAERTTSSTVPQGTIGTQVRASVHVLLLNARQTKNGTPLAADVEVDAVLHWL